MKVAEPTGMILTSLISGALSIRPRKAPTPMHKQMVKTAISEINRMRRTETFAFFPITYICFAMDSTRFLAEKSSFSVCRTFSKIHVFCLLYRFIIANALCEIKSNLIKFTLFDTFQGKIIALHL